MKPKPFPLCLLLAALLFGQITISACGSQGPRAPGNHSGAQGWIGVYVQDLDEDLRDYYDIQTRNGVLVNDVVDNSPAEKAGLQKEDVIVRFDGKRVRNTRDLTRAVKRTTPGEKVRIEIVRADKKKKLNLRVTEKPDHRYIYRSKSRKKYAPRVFGFGRHHKAWLGIRMAELNEDLADYFDVDAHEGVLILSVADDSPADKAGLKAGDVITRIEGTRIRNTDDVRDVLEDYEDGDDVEVIFKRRNRQRSVEVELTNRGSYRFEGHDGDFSFEFAPNIDEEKMAELQKRLRRDLDLDDLKIELRGLQDLNVDLEGMGEDLENHLQGMGEDLERNMERLSRELKKLNLQIRVYDQSI